MSRRKQQDLDPKTKAIAIVIFVILMFAFFKWIGPAMLNDVAERAKHFDIKVSR